MATNRQIAANRKNARRSTGPRTAAGKARSAMNSTKHGLLSQFRLIDDEDPQEFSKFADGARADFKPEGEVEGYYVRRWIQNAWLGKRLDKVQSALLQKEESLADLSAEDLLNAIEWMSAILIGTFDQVFVIIMGLNLKSVQSRLLDHLNYRILKMEKARSAQTPAETGLPKVECDAPSADDAITAMARSFSRKRVAFSHLLRYRAASERSLNDSLHEIQRLQALRRGLVVAVPEVVDVNVISNVTKRTQSSITDDHSMDGFNYVKSATARRLGDK